jgi:hypothetical protein
MCSHAIIFMPITPLWMYVCSNRSLLLFGHGDGGSGPAVSHLARLGRLQKAPGVPRIRLDQRPEHFFEDVEVKDFRKNSSLVALEALEEWQRKSMSRSERRTMTMSSVDAAR